MHTSLKVKRTRDTLRAMTTRVRTEPRAPEFANRLGALPAQPGVYLMKSANGGILYVGKAASLRNRVRSYFQTPYGKELRIQAMVRHIADFEFIVTESVQEALLLENLLIKQHKPFYNARLKDDKTYPYIKIDLAEEFPQVYFTRRVLADGARYFGPFASASSVRKTMDLLKKLFPLSLLHQDHHRQTMSAHASSTTSIAVSLRVSGWWTPAATAR